MVWSEHSQCLLWPGLLATESCRIVLSSVTVSEAAKRPGSVLTLVLPLGSSGIPGRFLNSPQPASYFWIGRVSLAIWLGYQVTWQAIYIECFAERVKTSVSSPGSSPQLTRLLQPPKFRWRTRTEVCMWIHQHTYRGRETETETETWERERERSLNTDSFGKVYSLFKVCNKIKLSQQ